MTDAQEEFCFSEFEENTEEAITRPKRVSVDITRSSPACGTASISLSLSFKSNGEIMCKYNYIFIALHAVVC